MLGQEASPQHFCSQHRKTEYRCCRGKEESPSSPFPIVNLYLSSTHNRKASILDSSVALYAIAYSLIIQHPRTVYLPSLPKQHKMQHTVIYLKEQPGAYWSDSGRLQFLWQHIITEHQSQGLKVRLKKRHRNKTAFLWCAPSIVFLSWKLNACLTGIRSECCWRLMKDERVDVERSAECV